jgi:hypothetical protein
LARPRLARRSCLLVHPHPDGISRTVTGDGDDATPAQVDPWRRAAKAAVALLGTRDHLFTWEAIVATAPRTVGVDRLGPLGEPQDIGPVRLAPGGVCMREQVPSERAESAGIRHSFPVIASGEFITYAWEPVALIAEQTIRRSRLLNAS